MDAQLRSMLNETEQALLRAAEPRELNRLDEDELAALHDRIRRARNKYSKLYRRRASERVTTDRSRGRASSANAKAARKAEGFEDALARVSHKLARGRRTQQPRNLRPSVSLRHAALRHRQASTKGRRRSRARPPTPRQKVPREALPVRRSAPRRRPRTNEIKRRAIAAHSPVST